MRLDHVSKIFPELPRYHYFEAGNIYTGSRAEMRFRIEPGEKLKTWIWHGNFCFEKSEIEETNEFENSEDGFKKMLEYLENYSKNDAASNHPKWENYEGWSREFTDNYHRELEKKRENGIF